MTTITQNDNRWVVEGDILMDTANQLLVKSKTFTLVGNTVVDFSQVAEIDTASVSLLLEWRRRAVAESAQLSFVNFPDGLTTLAELYGVTDLIN